MPRLCQRFPYADVHHWLVTGHTGVVSAVRCDVERVGTRLLVHVTGDLSVATARRLRMALFKCLMDQPDAVVVDVAGLTVSEPEALRVFSVVARQAALWPGSALLLCAPSKAVADLLAGGCGRLPVFESAEQALAVEPRRRMASLSEVLFPVFDAARQARDLVTEACARWDLPQLMGPACVVAGELVTNAVVHARTMMDLRITLGRRYLVIAVRDGSADLPRLAQQPLRLDAVGGRGLLLVDSLVRRWGSLPAEDGKVVWAALPISGPS
jgi:anti-anti-sigma regulatory factor